ncbi:BON1-associated protein 2-like [Lycium ferocissimum]|uniref:BON1-associated protein 2-like n=1 Tax=Lycium ferocissimum TaxID=112874 RepID=UPI00281581D0|nr:BON1-associated protein 2-like [Lycium ferocissimum]
MEHSTSSRVLEVTVISGEGLKKNTFVTIKTDHSCNTQTTRIDKEGGSCPTWNEKLFIDLPMHVSYLTIEAKCKNSSGNIKTIGIARIPTSDFIGGFLPEDYLQFLSYRLRDEKGAKNGIINLSVKVKNSRNSGGCAAAYSNIWKGAALPPTLLTWDALCTGLPFFKNAPVAVGNINLSGRLVTGIPIYPSSYY